MELILERIAKRKTYTIGRLYIRRQVMEPVFLRHVGTHLARL